MQVTATKRLNHPVASPVKETKSATGQPFNLGGAITNLRAPCIETDDVYYDLSTGEEIGRELVGITCSSGGGAPDGGGGGGGSGSTGTGTGGAASTAPPATVIPDECTGLKQALSTQSSDKKEVAGYVATDGTAIVFVTGGNGIDNSATSFDIPFPLYDSDHHLVTNGPFKENGIWKIEVNDWSNGTHTYKSYNIAYGFHTHPLGRDANGNLYKPDVPSPADNTNATKYAGMPQHIVNANNEVVYDSNHVISTTANHCK